MNRYAVVVFPRQPLTDEQQCAHSRNFGELEATLIVQMSKPMPGARAFIRDLTEHATQPQFTHAHRWRVKDLVMWDNRATMHRARRYRDLHKVRDLRRTSIKGTAMTAEQTAALAAE